MRKREQNQQGVENGIVTLPERESLHNSVPYSQLELYLMGMIPASDVAPFDVFRGVTFYDETTNEFEADTRVTYDSTRLRTELGVRSPSVATSQKDFRLLIVVLTDVPLTTADWDVYDQDSEAFGRKAADNGGYNFWSATGGRGTMQTGNLKDALRSAGIFAAKPYRPMGLAEMPGTGFMYNLLGRRMQRPVGLILRAQ